MNGIMNPTATLLDADSTPFIFMQEAVLRQMFGNIRWKDDMTAALKKGEAKV